MPSLYSWRQGSRCAVDAEVAAQELNRLAAQGGGTVQPDQVVEASRPEDAPLHPAFTWDDQDAAEEWRRHEARQLLGSLIVVVQTGNVEAVQVRAFTHITDGDRKAYHITTQAMEDSELRMRLLAKALSDLRSLQLKYASLQELATVFAATDEVAARARQEGAA